MTAKPRRPRAVFSDRVARRICNAVGIHMGSLKHLVEKDRSLPSEATIHAWRKTYPDFAIAFEEARTRRREAISDAGNDVIRACRQEVRAIFATGDRDARHRVNAEIAIMNAEVAWLDRQTARLEPKPAPQASARGAKAPKKEGAPFVLPDDLSDLIC